MSFLKPQIEYGTWIEIDGPCGTDVIPADLVDASLVQRWANSASPWAMDKLQALLGDYTENSKIYSVEVKQGHGARLSAPGYTDCTSWSVHPTRRDAEAALRDEDPYEDDE